MNQKDLIFPYVEHLAISIFLLGSFLFPDVLSLMFFFMTATLHIRRFPFPSYRILTAFLTEPQADNTIRFHNADPYILKERNSGFIRYIGYSWFISPNSFHENYFIKMSHFNLSVTFSTVDFGGVSVCTLWEYCSFNQSQHFGLEQ